MYRGHFTNFTKTRREINNLQNINYVTELLEILQEEDITLYFYLSTIEEWKN